MRSTTVRLQIIAFWLFCCPNLLAFNPSAGCFPPSPATTNKIFSAPQSNQQNDTLRGGSQVAIGSLRLFMSRELILEASEEIIIQESHAKRDIDGNGNTLFFAVRADGDDYQCEGYLIQNESSRTDGKFPVEAHIACHQGSVDHFLAVFQSLLLHYLEREEDFDECGIVFSYSVSDDVDLGSLASLLELKEHMALGLDLPKYVPFLHQYAFRHRGTDIGHTALHLLRNLCQRRAPYDFDTNTQNNGRSIISLQKQILSEDIVENVMEQMCIIKTNQWLSTNPDSVDGLPSLHLNLISNGKPLFGLQSTGMDGRQQAVQEESFETCISKMTSILQPHLEETLLPTVRELTKSSTVQISDVFIRNYGNMSINNVDETEDDADAGADADEEAPKTRYTLSPHYDITAFATCVMALDSTAASGKSGLYTIPPTNGVTNNAALRLFFPLDKGDGVVHTFDILHGVDVDPRLNRERTSLIVWFTDYGRDEKIEGEDEGTDNDDVNQPWLLNPSNAVEEFVLGLASNFGEEEDGSHLNLKRATDPLILNLSSASKGNIFAMTELGQMCDDGELSDTYYEQIWTFLEGYGPCNPFLPPLSSNDETNEVNPWSCKDLVTALWYHASLIGGSRVAQVSLADEIMLQYMLEKDGLTSMEQEQMLLMASTLFTMALHQGYDSMDSLRRLMDVNCERLLGLGVEIPSQEFIEDPVVKTLLLSH